MDSVHSEYSLSFKFGKRLRTLRTEKKMSQEELSFKAGITAAHLGQIERAEKKPTLETIGKLAEALDISLPELFTFETSSGLIKTAGENTVLSKIDAQLRGMTDEQQKDVLRIVRIFRRNLMKTAAES